MIRKPYWSRRITTHLSPETVFTLSASKEDISKIFFFLVANLGNGQSPASTVPKVSSSQNLLLLQHLFQAKVSGDLHCPGSVGANGSIWEEWARERLMGAAHSYPFQQTLALARLSVQERWLGRSAGSLIRRMDTRGIWIGLLDRALQYRRHSARGRHRRAISTLNDMMEGPCHASPFPSELDSILYSVLCARTGPSSLDSAQSPS